MLLVGYDVVTSAILDSDAILAFEIFVGKNENW